MAHADDELNVELDEFAVSYKPQKISPKFPGTVSMQGWPVDWCWVGTSPHYLLHNGTPSRQATLTFIPLFCVLSNCSAKLGWL
jgi:hypothetical protein